MPLDFSPPSLSLRWIVVWKRHFYVWWKVRQSGLGPRFIEVAESRLSLAEAVSCYLFNSQILSLPDGGMLLVCAQECAESPRAWNLIQEWIADPANPVRDARVLDLRQSMRNGGGPACLRLRVACDPGTVDPRFMVDANKLDQIAQIVTAHWPEEIAAADLQRPALVADVERARAALLDLLDLSALA